MPDQPEPSPKLKFSVQTIKERLKAATASVEFAAAVARELDWLGDADSHAEGSDQRALASVRDEMDRALSLLVMNIRVPIRHRAEVTRSRDLLEYMTYDTKGDGHDTLHLMHRLYEVFGEEEPAVANSFPDAFAWETY